MLGFQENQCSLHVMLRNYQFMHAAGTLLKTWVWRGWLCGEDAGHYQD